MIIRFLVFFLILTLLSCEQKKGDAQYKENTNIATSLENTQPLIAAKTITQQSLTNHIKVLASDEYGGRSPGSKGEELAVAYLQKAFQDAGLAPANNTSFLQAVPLTSVEAINKPSLLLSGSTGADLNFQYSLDQVIWTKKQVKALSVSNSKLVFVGYGINAPERQWNDYAEVDVRGKTVVILINDPGYASQNSELFNGNAMTYYGRWNYKFEEAARQGATGALIVHSTKPAAYPWSTVSSSWTGPQFDLEREQNTMAQLNIEGWITQRSAAALFNKAGLNIDAMYKAAKTPGFKAIEMNISVTASIKNTIAHINSHNVVGVIKGSKTPAEVFIYMAHWDHLGTDLSIAGDGIYNGALDNATGTAGLIEIAKAYKSLTKRPERSIVFLATTAEEQGLLGSAYYAQNPLFPLASTVGGINMDGLNNFGPTRDVTVIGLGMSQLDNYLEKQAKHSGRVLKPDAEAEKGYFYRSDHFELSKLGVPMLYPNSGYDHREKGIEYGMQKSEEYTAKYYHNPSDEYKTTWDLSGAVEDLQLYFLTGLEIANSTDWPQWNDGTEFKAIRELQRQAVVQQQ